MTKLITAIFALALSLAGAETTRATVPIGTRHHQLLIHATLRKVVVTGTTANVVLVPINNATIINSYVRNSKGGGTPSDFDIAIDDVSAEIDIIKKSDQSIVFTIGQQDGTTTTDAELFGNNPQNHVGWEVITGYLISLPGTPGPVRQDLILRLGVSPAFPAEFSHVITRFFAGFDEGQPDSYILEGTAASTEKMYTY